MPNLTLRGIPDDIHAELKAAAKRNHRSLNGEILFRLTTSVGPETEDRDALLARIERRRRAIGPMAADRAELLERITREREAAGSIDLDDETIRELKNAGRR
ncbi:MAG: Arc family DNA-binding protein [Chloroflexi bacterium]|nr:Arc family DNA-binding protein [Chloroflexota bacterium]MXZ46288.1 Arc family DNA-binding protein [Chloroflexota bacterium]MYE32849.1 Arc family DNA-binding protein [Chloroflexota bacterium]